MLVLQADLEASFRVAARAYLLILPIRATLGSKFAEELEREVRELVEDLVEHACELREHVTDGRVEDLRKLAQT